MKYYGTKNNKDYGFYEEKFDNAVEISDEYWQKLLNCQNYGNIIILYEGNVIAVKNDDYEFKDGKWRKLEENEIKSRQLSLEIALRRQAIQEELEELDKKRIRALAEPALKDDEVTWLEYYNNKILSLRKELASL